MTGTVGRGEEAQEHKTRRRGATPGQGALQNIEAVIVNRHWLLHQHCDPRLLKRRCMIALRRRNVEARSSLRRTRLGRGTRCPLRGVQAFSYPELVQSDSQRGSGYQCIKFKHALTETHQFSPTRGHGVFHPCAGGGVNPSA